MARRSRMSMLKRQREVRKAEKAARKRARRHGVPIERAFEPKPTISSAELMGRPSDEDEQEEVAAEPGAETGDDSTDPAP